jgi:hypothetical protein
MAGPDKEDSDGGAQAERHCDGALLRGTEGPNLAKSVLFSPTRAIVICAPAAVLGVALIGFVAIGDCPSKSVEKHQGCGHRKDDQGELWQVPIVFSVCVSG